MREDIGAIPVILRTLLPGNRKSSPLLFISSFRYRDIYRFKFHLPFLKNFKEIDLRKLIFIKRYKALVVHIAFHDKLRVNSLIFITF